MVTSRLFYANLLTPTTPLSFNLAGGAVAYAPVPASQAFPVYPYAGGNVTFTVQGTFTGLLPMRYVVQVTSSTDGTFAGTRYRWSDTDGVTWTPAAAPYLTPTSGGVVSLSNGVQIIFTASSLAPEFVVADEWDFLAVRKYPMTHALDGIRNTEYRSGTTPANSTIRTGWDLGIARQPQVFVLDDHNIPSNAVTTLWGNSSLFTESGGFSQICTPRPNRIVELITSGAFRYWWWKVVLPASPLVNYLRWSEAFLGTGATLNQCPDIGPSNDLNWLGSIDVETATRRPHPRVYTAAEPQYTWSLVKEDPTEDGGKLTAALVYARDHISYTMPPLWVLLRDDVLSSLEVYSWVGSGLQRKHRFLDRWDYSVSWAQVIRTVAS